MTKGDIAIRVGVAVLFIVLYFWAIYPVAISWLGPSPFEGVRIPVERSDLGPQEHLTAREAADPAPEKRMRRAVKALKMNWDGNLCEGFLR